MSLYKCTNIYLLYTWGFYVKYYLKNSASMLKNKIYVYIYIKFILL